MAATAVDAPTGAGTGTRRAVVKSEKFMEWQRDLNISRSVSAVRKLGHSSALLTTERHSSDEDVKMPMGGPEGSEEREGEGEGEAAVVADSQGGADGGAEADQQRGNKGKKTTQQQRQRSEAKKVRKEEGDQNQKKGNLSSGKDPAAVAGEGEGGRLRRCKQQGNPGSGVKRAATTQQQQVAQQPLARKRQRRIARPFSPPKEDVERGLRSLTRNRGSEGVLAATRAAATTNCSKGATKRSKRVAQRLANEEPAPPPLKLPKLHIILTRKEIQEDWLKITGHKYTGKPRKSLLVGRGMGLCQALTCPSTIKYLNDPQ